MSKDGMSWSQEAYKFGGHQVGLDLPSPYAVATAAPNC